MQPVATRIANQHSFNSLVKYIAKDAQDGKLYGTAGAQITVAESHALHGNAPAAHLVLNYGPGHVPDIAQVLADVQVACIGAGWNELPRTSAIHIVADSVHVHVVVAMHHAS